jgi:diguanylate cyclase (GGDEF)-like protein/PAS domain S-box-containing protein
MGRRTHADRPRVEVEGDPVIPRRGRPTGLGQGHANGQATFARDSVLREATVLGVCPEDRARLETLARFAYTSPGFRAVSPVSLGADRSRQVLFEVRHTAEGPVARRIDGTGILSGSTEGARSGPAPRNNGDHANGGRPRPAPSDDGLASLLCDAAEHSPALMATFGATGRKLLWANDSLRRQLQVPAWAAPPLIELLDDSSQGHFVVKVLPCLLRQGWWQGRLGMVGPDVDAVPVLASLVAQHTAAGARTALVLSAQVLDGAGTGVPARRDAEEHFAALVEHVSDLIAVIEPGGIIRYASPAASTMLGHAPGDLAGTPLVDLLHPDDQVDRIERLVQVDAQDGTGMPTGLRLRAADGSWRSIEAVVTDLTANPAIRGYVLNGRDTTERVRAYEMLSHLAYTDPETGLPNRLRLIDRLTTLLEDPTRTRPLAVLVVDLDDFRTINSSHGPRLGDALLGEIAHRLVEGAGADAVVARLRSVEFAVTLPDVREPNVAERAADALRVIVARPFTFEGQTARVTASIGIAVGTGTDQADDLLGRAGQAATEAKQSGGNRIAVWGEETAKREKRRRVVEQRLQRVLDEGGLRVDYQPVVALDGGALVGAEALLRVRDHDEEVLNPAEFVEAAESSGLLARLGTQMLEATCEQLSRWDAQLRSRAPDHVCVNVSPRQLLDPGLATQVVAALESSALDPGRLWLEVTESTLLDQSGELGHRIAFLRDLGVRVGLDEFGAGYSTLNYLKRFPLDFVKIDRTLVAGLGRDPRDTAIVRATVELAHSLGLTVVAVGIETRSQLEDLCNLGCDHAQGYLLSAPMAPDDLLVALEHTWLTDIFDRPAVTLI